MGQTRSRAGERKTPGSGESLGLILSDNFRFYCGGGDFFSPGLDSGFFDAGAAGRGGAEAGFDGWATGGLDPGPPVGGLYPGPVAGGLYPGPAVVGGLYPGPAVGGLYPGPAVGGLYPVPAVGGL